MWPVAPNVSHKTASRRSLYRHGNCHRIGGGKHASLEHLVTRFILWLSISAWHRARNFALSSAPTPFTGNDFIGAAVVSQTSEVWASPSSIG